jgi:glutathione S-transferase
MAAPYTLHGVWLSGPTYRVALMLAMSGQKFDYEFVNLREGAHKKPEYLAKNRFGVVPCLTVAATGENLCQAASILGYLSQTTGKFAGVSATDQREIREWLLWNYDRLVPPVYRMRAAKIGFRQMDAATSEMYANEGKMALKTLDDHLKGREWIVGKAASIADIDVYGVAHYATAGGFDLAAFPNVQAWIKRFEALPGYGTPEALLPKESMKAA